MLDWKTKFRGFIRQQEDVFRSDKSQTTEAKATNDALIKMLEEIYTAQSLKIDSSLERFEDAREAYAVFMEESKMAQRQMAYNVVPDL